MIGINYLVAAHEPHIRVEIIARTIICKYVYASMYMQVGGRLPLNFMITIANITRRHKVCETFTTYTYT